MKRLLTLLLALLIPCAALCDSGVTIPDLTADEVEIPDNEAMAFLRRMGLGWNLGNTLDAYGAWYTGEMNSETCWGNPRTTAVIFQALKEAGFGYVRIPITWHGHFDSGYTISDAWMDRVQEVVDMALDAGLIVIINTHHDNDVRYYYPDRDHEEESCRFVSRIWEQVAARFADYDERLIFENLNEPRLVGTSYEWTFNTAMPVVREAAEIINEMNQLFVDTVRASGGYNAERYLSVCGYAASVDGINPQYFTLPADTADNRIIVAAHAYSPYNFALNTSGTAAFSLDSASDRSGVISPLQTLYVNWISKGIPAYMGEFGSVDKHNPQARVDHAALYVSTAAQWNIPVTWWDNGAFSGGGELFGILNRRTGAFTFSELVETMTRYSLREAVTAD